MSAYHSVESVLDLSPLLKYCQHYEERFPLLVAKAACMHLSQSFLPGERSQSNSTTNSGAAGIPQGDVWQVQLWQSGSWRCHDTSMHHTQLLIDVSQC